MTTAAPPIPRIELAQAPTPLLKLERLSAELGIELWLKRDDFTGLLETGNKIRKLEFLVGDALEGSAWVVLEIDGPGRSVTVQHRETGEKHTYALGATVRN